ncbi:hypothetical protein ELH40_07645 [Rhizobium ruizarguesonis]|uniref:Uncharacterized protein n=1 Tax=Rhizobium ruizarguesonis TaxID=2081791 RepID=A0AB38I4K4_9HYPH|nr:hypothetical protein ELH40_07645 [Rhizobium ruizarguesonis]
MSRKIVQRFCGKGMRKNKDLKRGTRIRKIATRFRTPMSAGPEAAAAPIKVVVIVVADRGSRLEAPQRTLSHAANAATTPGRSCMREIAVSAPASVNLSAWAG